MDSKLVLASEAMDISLLDDSIISLPTLAIAICLCCIDATMRHQQSSAFKSKKEAAWWHKDSVIAISRLYNEERPDREFGTDWKD